MYKRQVVEAIAARPGVERYRARLLDDLAMQRLPDGRWQVEWQTKNPRLHERYALKWEW